MSAFEKIFGTHSERELKRIKPIVDKVESYHEAMGKLSDDELKDKTKEFKKRLADGETLDDILPEAYATVREAAKRVLGMEHYRVQIIGGIILHQGRIAEMRTGEGKTLVSTLPAYLNALEEKGVCIVTVNDYLAKRDAEWMGKVHEFLGLTVGIVLGGMDNDERRAAYGCDITYVTNNELGFDYLRDNMVIYKEQLVQRGLHYAIIDEVDSVLIDEARTPLIISGQSGKSTRLYEACDILATQMKRGEDVPEYSKMDALMGVIQDETGDFIVNEKDKVVNLTQEGVHKVEQFFHIENLADPENLEIQHNIILALRAHNLMFKDQDYVVKDDEVLIVDEFTGRIMPGRRYSDGLHQAIEAKEHVKVKRESKTLATITFQNFFNKFDKKAGMTGTALTEEKEFRDIYGMDVVEIPTNRPVARIDHQDAVYKTKKEKFKAVVESVKEAHEKGQPVLVGTITIETSELISGMLKREGIKHTVLNAKFHEQEAEIVALAGQHGAVTIATNMAGRGTDIKLDDEAKAAGGLKIIGTERHESRRIDNQLRGRAGRQGDPGESQFFISLEDDLMRLFGSERLMSVFTALGVPEGEQIQHRRHGHQRVLGFFAQMLPHPFFKGGLLLGGVVVVPHAHLCRVHHVAVAHDHAFDHGNGTAHQRDLRPYPVGGGGVELGLNGTVRFAHGTAHLFGAAHHDALHQCLPAYAGLKAFLFRLIHWFLPISAPAACGKGRSFLYFIRGISPIKAHFSTQM